MNSIDRIKELRQKSNQNQSEIANSINVSRESYCMYENGKRDPSYETLVSLASLYHVSLDYILNLTDVPLSFAYLSDRDREIVSEILGLSDVAKEALMVILKSESSF